MSRTCRGTRVVGPGTYVLVAIVVCGHALRAGAAEVSSRADVEKLVGQLESADFEVRRAAQLRLNSLGGEALPVVEAALADAAMGPEAQNRLRAALPYLKARARREGPERERLAWKFAQLRAAYDAGPDQSPMWDKEAREAIDLFTKLPRGGAGWPAARAAALAAFAKAADLGAEDPLFLTMYHLTVGEKFGRKEGTVGDSFEHVIWQVQRAGYAPIIKVWAVARYVGATRTCDPQLWECAVREFTKAAKTPGLPPTELGASANQLFDALERVGEPHDIGNERLRKAYSAAAPGTHGALYLEGRVQFARAAEVFPRLSRDPNVRPNLRAAFNDALAQAAEALEAAWKLDPTDARPAALLIACQLGNRGGGREGVETWFARAVEADPDCLAAYERKMYALNPGWLGDAEYKDVIAFGRDCLGTQNWRAGIPMLLVRAHAIASEASGDAKEYYARSDVWTDLAGVYEGQLVNYPDDGLRRSELANAAAQSGRWKIVRAQFEALGDRAAPAAFGGKANMDYLKRTAARLGGATTAPANGTGG